MAAMESQEILKLLEQEAALFNATNGSPRHIGWTWFQLAFDAIHSIVCGRGNWPHPAGVKCNEHRNPRTFDQNEWDQGSIADLALRLIDDKFLKEGQSSVILAASSDRHCANLAARHASQLLYRIQTKEREAGRITERLVRIFDGRGQYFAGDESTKPYFSSDGLPVSPSDPDPAPILEPILSRMPVRPWKGGDHEEGSPYGVATLRVAATNILETVRAVGKWAIFDIFEIVLAHQQNVFLAIGRGVPRATGSALGDGIDGNSVISMQFEGLSDVLIEDARLFARETLGDLTDQERQIWSIHGESASTIEQLGLSRQTHANRMQKLAKSIIEKAETRTNIHTSDMDSSDVQEYCLVVFEELTSLLDSEKQSV